MTQTSSAAGPAIRSQFLLRRGVVYLNHGAFGACPRPVFRTYQRWQRTLERQPVAFLGRRFRTLMRTARTALAAYLNADPDDLVYVPNATTALNTVARSLPLGPGDEVLSTDHEYGAADRLWQFVCGLRGARYVKAAVPVPVESAEQVVDAVWSRVTDRTRVLFCSHVTSPTALIFPLDALLRRARAAGILTVVDGAHAPGQIPVDLRALDPDFYAGNCHKWLCAPKGAGFLYARRDRHDLLQPLVVSWGWDPDGPPSRHREATGGGLVLGRPASRLVAEHEWQGTRDIAACLSVPAAIRFLEEHLDSDGRHRCHELARVARREISALTGLPPLSPDAPAWYAQMVSVPLPVCDPDAAHRRLRRDARVEVPVFRWGSLTLLRVSVHLYTEPADIEALVAGVRRLLG